MKIWVTALVFVLMVPAIPAQAKKPTQVPQRSVIGGWRQKMATCKPLWQKMKRHDTNGQYHFPENPSAASMLISFPQNTSANNFQ